MKIPSRIKIGCAPAAIGLLFLIQAGLVSAAEPEPLAATVVTAEPSAFAGSQGATGTIEPFRRATPSTVLSPGSS